MTMAVDVLLVDGSSYLYRAYHALPPLMNSKGMATGAVYGVVHMLRKLQTDVKATYFAVVFDAKGKTFRDELFEAYKAHRPSMPDDLQQQIAPLHAIIKALGIPLLMVDGVEADDVIGTLAQAAAADNLNVMISTGDKDFAQLVNDRILLSNSMTNTLLDAAGVVTKFGVKPSQIIDYLTLIGDSSDNIPGVPGVGPKTAAKWLQAYDTIDNLLAHRGDLKGKVVENLANAIPQFAFVKQLLTIKCDVPLECGHGDLILQTANKAALKTLYSEMEFKTLLRDLSGDTQSDLFTESTAIIVEKIMESTDFQFHTVLAECQLQIVLDKLQAVDAFALDTETNALNTLTAEIVGISLAFDGMDGYYIPFRHDYLGAPLQLNREHVFKVLKPYLESSKKVKILQNAKFDLNVLKNYSITLAEPIIDTQLQSYVWRSTERHNMDALAAKYLHTKTVSFEEVAGKGVKQLHFNEIDLAIAAPYAAEDAVITWRLYESFHEKLRHEPALLSVLNTIELPLVPILAKLERQGVLIDASLLKAQSHDLNKRLLKLEQQAFVLAGQAFNLNSPKQLQDILFGKLALPCTQKTPTGQASTSEEVLQDLSGEFELPRVILEFRSLAKLKSTYTDSLPDQISAKTGRVHTSYQQAVVPTGRLSSTNPNLQNIPVRTLDGRKIRQAFIAPPGYKLLAADYSQIELRIMAHMAQDKRLLAAFAANEDIHKATAAEVFNTPLEAVTAIERRNAKAINFGLMYGMSSFGLAKQLTISRDSAQHYIDAYFARYPDVKIYMENTRLKAHELGYVETLFGRRLYLPEINAKAVMRVKAAERAAINAPLQGTAADVIKKAMISIDQWLIESQAPIQMIMQVHDELVFEVRDNYVELATQKIRALMSGAANFATPLVVDIGTGDNWDQAH